MKSDTFSMMIFIYKKIKYTNSIFGELKKLMNIILYEKLYDIFLFDLFELVIYCGVSLTSLWISRVLLHNSSALFNCIA